MGTFSFFRNNVKTVQIWTVVPRRVNHSAHKTNFRMNDGQTEARIKVDFSSSFVTHREMTYRLKITEVHFGCIISTTLFSSTRIVISPPARVNKNISELISYD